MKPPTTTCRLFGQLRHRNDSQNEATLKEISVDITKCVVHDSHDEHGKLQADAAFLATAFVPDQLSIVADVQAAYREAADRRDEVLQVGTGDKPSSSRVTTFLIS